MPGVGGLAGRSRNRSHDVSDVIKPGVLGAGVGVPRLKVGVGVGVTGVSHMIKSGVHRSRSSIAKSRSRSCIASDSVMVL